MSKFAPQSVRDQAPIGVSNRQMFENVCSVVRDDWHEPDESYITARVFGTELDNAFGSSLMDPTESSFQEMVIVLYQNKRPVCTLNLATVLAGYARSLKPANYAEVGESR